MGGDLVFWVLLLAGLWLLRRRLMAVVWGLAPIVLLLVVLYLIVSGEAQRWLAQLG